MAEREKSHIVVFGGGFGGLTFCQYFHHPAARATPNVHLPFVIRHLLLAIGHRLLAIGYWLYGSLLPWFASLPLIPVRVQPEINSASKARTCPSPVLRTPSPHPMGRGRGEGQCGSS